MWYWRDTGNVIEEIMMQKNFFTSLIATYERLVTSRLALYIWMLGGALVVLLILAILLMLRYPPYVWCVFGGVVIIWVLGMLVGYGLMRIAYAEQQVKILQSNNLEQAVSLIASVVTTAIDYYNNRKKK